MFTPNANFDDLSQNWMPVTRQQDAYSDSQSTIVNGIGLMCIPTELCDIVMQNAVDGDIVECRRIGNRYELYVNTFFVASATLG